MYFSLKIYVVLSFNIAYERKTYFLLKHFRYTNSLRYTNSKYTTTIRSVTKLEDINVFEEGYKREKSECIIKCLCVGILLL